ncbi:phosphonoacetaldehyde hydrolase, partial [Pseudomonas sp. BAgro211]|nr:phosphonoacetaldehyde hydrolase [Pseudomonas sp. BAgro211]
HIRTLCDIPAIAERYKAKFGRVPSDDDVTAIYERFMPLQIEKIAEHSALIPGARDAIAALRKQGLKIGSCSGYPAVVMEKV